MNMQAMMRQVQKMQKEMTQEQERLQQTVFTAKSASDLIVVEVLGNRTIKNIEIKPEVIDPEDPDMLQDLLITTLNDAMKQIDTKTEQTMGRFTQGMNLPF